MKDGKAWVGDEVHDEDAGRTGMLTDVSGGIYFVRPLTGGGADWTALRARGSVPLRQLLPLLAPGGPKTLM